jgi:hypothetical protein
LSTHIIPSICVQYSSALDTVFHHCNTSTNRLVSCSRCSETPPVTYSLLLHMLKPPAQKYKKRELLASSHPPTMNWLHSKTFCTLSISSRPLFNPVFSLFLPPLVWGWEKIDSGKLDLARVDYRGTDSLSNFDSWRILAISKPTPLGYSSTG